MFRQIIVFTRDQTLASCQALAHESAKKGLTCHFFNPFAQSPDELLQNFDQSDLLIMPRTSGVLFDDWDLTLLEACLKRGAISTHSPFGIATLRDKDRQYLFLKHQELRCVPTLIHRGQLTASDLSKFDLSNQWVLKSTRGNKGIGHELLDTHSLLKCWATKVSTNDQRFIIQPYFKKVEHRLLVLGKDSFLFEKVLSDENDWKKNAESSTFKEVTPSSHQQRELENIQEVIQRSLGLKTMAIDLFLDDDGYEILEVNAHPGLQAAQRGLNRSTNLYSKFLDCYLNS